MKSYKLEDMTRGWIVGNFDPSVYKTEECEVGFKVYKAGDREVAHHHKIATEITVVISGRIRMKDKEWSSGDIIVIDPGESTEFEALTDASNLVIKLPGATDDKYID